MGFFLAFCFVLLCFELCCCFCFFIAINTTWINPIPYSINEYLGKKWTIICFVYRNRSLTNICVRNDQWYVSFIVIIPLTNIWVRNDQWYVSFFVIIPLTNICVWNDQWYVSFIVSQSIFSSSMIYYRNFNNSRTPGEISGRGNAYPSGVYEYIGF